MLPHRRNPVLAALLLALPLAPPLAGQGAATPSPSPATHAPATDPDTGELLLAIQAAREAGRRDAALVALWAAERSVERDLDATRAARHRAVIAELRLALDPHSAARSARDTAAAEELLKLARAYQRKNLWRRAHELLRAAGDLDPKVIEKALPYVEKKAKAAAAAQAAARAQAASEPPADQSTGPLAQLQTQVVSGIWDLGANEVRSPELTDGVTRYVVGAAPTHADNRVEIDVLIGDKPGSAALMIGAKSAQDYFLVQLTHVPDERDPSRISWSAVDLYQYAGDKRVPATLGGSEVRLTPEQRRGWLKIGAVIEGPVVTLEFQERAVARIQCETIPHGAVGFFISGDTPNRDPVRFRGLQIGPPTEREPGTAAAPAPTTPLDELNDELERLTELGAVDAEAAASELNDLRRRAVTILTSRTERDGFREACDERLAKLDPLHRSARKTFATLAESLVELATEYRTAELPQAAMALLSRAAHSDEAATDAEWKLLQPQLEAVQAASAAAEQAARVASNQQLVEWFEGGEQLFTSAGWTVSDADGARSPEMRRASTVLLGKPEPTLPLRCSVRLSLPSDDDRSAGLAFGVRGARGFNLAVVHRLGRSVEIELLEWQNSTWRPLGKRSADMREAAGDGEVELTLDLELAPAAIRASVRGGPQLRYDRGDLTLAGKIGLYAENRADQAGRVTFAGFAAARLEDD